MTLHRKLLVFVGASLILGYVAWSLWPCSKASEVSESGVVHFKLRAGSQSLQWLAVNGEVSPLFTRSPELLAADLEEAKALGAAGTPDLARWFRVDGAKNPAALVEKLQKRDEVADVFIAPVPELALVDSQDVAVTHPGAACPVTTPSYDWRQGYLAEAPGGIDVTAAWAVPGGRGEHVGFADIEGAWNAHHEDIASERMHDVGGRHNIGRSWVAHGTAVVGVVAAKDNQLGMVGIAPGVSKIVTASFEDIGVAAAIDAAQAQLQAGDVLLIELQGTGPRRRYVPMEYWGDVFDAVKVATSRGVIVVAAAGNGDENLDHKVFKRKFDRHFRDSGAILVGAGAPRHAGYVERSRLSFSNYGTRVDVQGWGYKVASLDYGDLQDCGAPHRRHYTAEFGGTSSASPIVTGAALLLQSIYKERNGSVMSPASMRELLRRTGSPQVNGPHGSPEKKWIGPLPDLKAALAELR